MNSHDERQRIERAVALAVGDHVKHQNFGRSAVLLGSLLKAMRIRLNSPEMEEAVESFAAQCDEDEGMIFEIIEDRWDSLDGCGLADAQAVEMVVENAIRQPEPEALAVSKRYFHGASERATLLASICIGLQKLVGKSRPLFFSESQVQKWLRVNPKTAHFIIKRFESRGLLICAERGTRTRATRWYWAGLAQAEKVERMKSEQKPKISGDSTTWQRDPANPQNRFFMDNKEKCND